MSRYILMSKMQYFIWIIIALILMLLLLGSFILGLFPVTAIVGILLVIYLCIAPWIFKKLNE
jgi:hypothetical protein